MSRRKPRPRLYSPRVWPTWLLVGFGHVMARLPTSVLIATGKLIGILGLTFGRSRRHIAEVNIGLCFPDASDTERAAIVRNSFIHTGVGIAEMALAWFNPQRLRGYSIATHGVEHLLAAEAQGNGVLLLGGHFAVMDMISGELERLCRLDVIYRANKDPVWERAQVAGRAAYFDRVIERSDVRTILKRLGSGSVVWYAADQDYGPKHSVFAPFFGVPAATITATSRFASRTGAAVVGMSQFRDLKTRTWRIEFSPLAGFPTGDPVADATRTNQWLETQIRKAPAQYLWLHRRFKTTPQGGRRPY